MTVLLLFLCLLLAGCAAPEAAPAGQAAVSFSIGTEPCRLEAGQDGLLLIYEQEEESKLCLFSPENFSLLAEAAVPGTDCRRNGGFLICFDRDSDTLFLLRADLSEAGEVVLPAPVYGSPLLCSDGKTVFYSSGEELRRLDIAAGTDNVILRLPDWALSPEEILMDDSLILCRAYGEEIRTIFVSNSGAILANRTEQLPIVTGQSSFYTHIYYGTCDVLYYGENQQKMQMLPLPEGSLLVDFLPEQGKAVTLNASQLVLFDLSSGKRTACLELEKDVQPIRAVGIGSSIAILTANEQGEQSILIWNPALSPVHDETVYTTPLYTEASPDIKGLNRCRERAEQLGSQYGITILLGADAVQSQPRDYLLMQEYIVPVLEEKLNLLEKKLASFPKGFLKALSDNAGGISLCLVRSIEGVSEADALELAAGLHFWDSSGCILAVSAGSGFQRAVFHELFHIADEQLLALSKTLADWNSLNPSDFEYDRNYQDYAQHANSIYLRPELRYFVDAYSMTFPAEDRARLLECAVTEGYESMFRSPALQAKLRTLCTAIRTVFPMDEKAVLWEQYLQEPIQ